MFFFGLKKETSIIQDLKIPIYNYIKNSHPASIPILHSNYQILHFLPLPLQDLWQSHYKRTFRLLL